jgi:hypothetical protein
MNGCSWSIRNPVFVIEKFWCSGDTIWLYSFNATCSCWRPHKIGGVFIGAVEGLQICISNDVEGLCECHGKRVVEVKCPYKHRDNTYQDFIVDPNCCIYDRNKLKLSHPYYSQVQLQMYVHDVSNCDLTVVCWSWRVSNSGRIHITKKKLSDLSYSW